MSVEPTPSPWRFPALDDADESGLIGVGADMDPGTILAAYRSGIFPMPVQAEGPMGWWSPDPRGVIELAAMRVSRSLRRSVRRFEIRVDTALPRVIDHCADPFRPHGWIDDRVRAGYLRLHELGWCHSVEAWRDGRLVGGLYGIALGGLFAGESMFHLERDASKAALVALVRGLDDGERRLVDVQWRTDHLASLGAVDRPRARYVAELPDLLATTQSPFFAGGARTISEAFALVEPPRPA